MTDPERARVAWSCRRGLLELDLLLQPFIERGYDQLDAAGRARFRAMLELPDPQLLACLLGQEPPPCQGWDHVIQEIRRAAAPPA